MVGVNREYADEARKNSRYLVVRSPRGEVILFPKALKGMKTFSKIFKRPHDPMRMYAIKVMHGEKKPREFFEVS